MIIEDRFYNDRKSAESDANVIILEIEKKFNKDNGWIIENQFEPRTYNDNGELERYSLFGKKDENVKWYNTKTFEVTIQICERKINNEGISSILSKIENYGENK